MSFIVLDCSWSNGLLYKLEARALGSINSKSHEKKEY